MQHFVNSKSWFGTRQQGGRLYNYCDFWLTLFHPRVLETVLFSLGALVLYQTICSNVYSQILKCASLDGGHLTQNGNTIR